MAELIADEAEHKAADAALGAAEDAAWHEPPPTPSVALPSLTGSEPRRLTLAELRDARSRDRLLLPPDDGTLERSLREMLDWN